VVSSPKKPIQNQLYVETRPNAVAAVTGGMKIRWALIGALITLLIGGGVWLTVRFITNFFGPGKPTTVDCSYFASFVDQPTMPAGMEQAKCTYRAFLDISLTADFDLKDQAVLDEWLAGVATAPQLEDTSCGGSSMCASTIFTPSLEGGAEYFEVNVMESSNGPGIHVTMLTGTT